VVYDDSVHVTLNAGGLRGFRGSLSSRGSRDSGDFLMCVRSITPTMPFCFLSTSEASDVSAVLLSPSVSFIVVRQEGVKTRKFFTLQPLEDGHRTNDDECDEKERPEHVIPPPANVHLRETAFRRTNAASASGGYFFGS
jgi:hypothetical protein